MKKFNRFPPIKSLYTCLSYIKSEVAIIFFFFFFFGGGVGLTFFFWGGGENRLAFFFWGGGGGVTKIGLALKGLRNIQRIIIVLWITL